MAPETEPAVEVIDLDTPAPVRDPSRRRGQARTWLAGVAAAVVLIGIASLVHEPDEPAPTVDRHEEINGPMRENAVPYERRAAEAAAAPVEIGIVLDRQVADAATEDFAAVVTATLTDLRGWQRAGFRFAFGDGSPYTLVLAEAEVVDALCLPYDTSARYSCQIGSVVALNADRWRTATPEWTGDLATYRQMLVNHEVGHLLGQHHPELQCPGAGQPAPVMAQQSTELGDCMPNAWPLTWEIECAARHEEPLAPGYEPDPVPTCVPSSTGGPG